MLGNEMVEVKRGSFITSEIKLMERWGWSKEKLRRYLKLLESDGMIVKKSDHKKTVITIVKYEDFQGDDSKSDHEQTASRPPTDHERDTNKNDKNVKNDKEIYMSAPSGADVCDLPDGAQSKKTGKGQKKTPAEKSGEYTQEFEQFWSIYPRKAEKKRAFNKWSARLKEGVGAIDLINAARSYAAYCRNNGTEEKYIKHAATFLGPDKPYEEYLARIPQTIDSHHRFSTDDNDDRKKILEVYGW
jgi:hypothetical protein